VGGGRRSPDYLQLGAIEWAIVNRLRFRRPHIHLEDGFHRILVDAAGSG